MACFGKSLAGAGYVVLNVIRVLNIISLLAVIAACTVMLVKTIGVSSFFFFDACEHVIRIVISGFLILTELPLFKPYFSKNWPLFSPRSGFVMLGFAMVLLGNSLLSNLNKEATSQDNLGMPFWRLVIGAGIVVVVMGPVNIAASYIFRDNKSGLTARQVRSHGAVAPFKADMEAASTPKPNRKSHYRSFFLGKRDSLPSYHSRAHTNMTQNSKTKLVISSPIQTDKHVLASPGGASSKYSQSPKSERHYASSPQLNKPELAHHPALAGHHVI